LRQLLLQVEIAATLQPASIAPDISLFQRTVSRLDSRF